MWFCSLLVSCCLFSFRSGDPAIPYFVFPWTVSSSVFNLLSCHLCSFIQVRDHPFWFEALVHSGVILEIKLWVRCHKNIWVPLRLCMEFISWEWHLWSEENHGNDVIQVGINHLGQELRLSTLHFREVGGWQAKILIGRIAHSPRLVLLDPTLCPLEPVVREQIRRSRQYIYIIIYIHPAHGPDDRPYCVDRGFGGYWRSMRQSLPWLAVLPA